MDNPLTFQTWKNLESNVNILFTILATSFYSPLRRTFQIQSYLQKLVLLSMVNMCGPFGCDIFTHILEETNGMSVFKVGWLYVFIAIIKCAGILSRSSLHINAHLQFDKLWGNEGWLFNYCSWRACEAFEHKTLK